MGESDVRRKGIREELRERLRVELNSKQQVTDEELYEMVDVCILETGQRVYLPLKEKVQLRTSLFNSSRRLDVLQQVMDNPEITGVMINRKDHIFAEEGGQVKPWDYEFESEEQLEDMIQQVVSRVNRVVNVLSPIVDAKMPDGPRVHVVLPPMALDKPTVTIWKFPRAFTMDSLIETEALIKEVAELLKKLAQAGYNIFISDGTNSGKTTSLNALSAYIPEDERIITIEDSAEFQIQHVQNLMRMEARNASAEGGGAISIGDLIRASPRMNPDRVIVSEIREKRALELLNVYNTGHDRGLSSGHGNSPRDMLARLETVVLMGADLPLVAIRSRVASTLDIMIHLGWLRDKSREVLWITEVGDYEKGEIRLNALYRFEDIKEKGTLKKVRELKAREKLWAAGDSL